MHPVQSIGYAAAYPAYPLNPPLVLTRYHRPAPVTRYNNVVSNNYRKLETHCHNFCQATSTK